MNKIIALLLLCNVCSARVIDTIVVHTTAFDGPIEYIDKYHRSLGWNGCGYHYIIDEDCIVHQCRDVDTIGAHVAGHNSRTLGVAWHGSAHRPPKKQYECLKVFVHALKILFNVEKIEGHNVYDTAKEQGKTCPNMDMDKFREELQLLTNGGHTL